jgi:hypothetical protein
MLGKMYVHYVPYILTFTVNHREWGGMYAEDWIIPLDLRVELPKI